ncbi:MAG: alanine racemase [Chloroflexota bacterium]
MTAPFPSWLEVDLDAVESNVRWLAQVVGSDCQIAAVVKAEAYGLGADEIGHAAIRGGASQLAVARVHEGVALRRAGVSTPILVLSAMVAAEMEHCIRWDLTPTVVEPAMISALERLAEGLGRTVPVHLKIDTGLTRYGAQIETAAHLGRLLLESNWITAEGLYTHFASSDEPDLDFTYAQVHRFQQVRSCFRELGLEFARVHAANSAGAIRVPEARFSMARTGITLSGYAPSSAVPTDGLRPAAALKASLARTYELDPGVTIGYGRIYTVSRRLRAGLVPLGYADGVPRALSNRGTMLIQGQRVPIIGRVSMDQAVVDLSSVPEARQGDEVVALGTQGEECISLAEFAAVGDTIPHEALCRFGPRLPRVYLRGGEITRILCFEGTDPSRV